MRPGNRDHLLIVRYCVYLSGSNQKTETTKGLSSRGSLIEGTDCPGVGGLRSDPEQEKMLLLFLAGSTVGKGSFARARSWAPRRWEGTGQGCPWGCGGRGRSTSGAGRRGSGCRRCCGSRDGVEIPRLLPFSDSPVVRQPSLWPSLPWRPGNHTTPMQDTIIIEDSCRLLMKEKRRVGQRIPESHTIFLLPCV